MIETVRFQCWALDNLGLTWLPGGWLEEPVNTRRHRKINFSYQRNIGNTHPFSHPAGATDPSAHNLFGISHH